MVSSDGSEREREPESIDSQDAEATVVYPATASESPQSAENPEAQTSLQRDFGNYVLLEELGRGGMGVVYKARQKNPNRIVAVKMILGGRMASDDDLQRFLNEAESSARLEHRYIVTVYEVGEHEGHHYFSMEYVEGESLADKLRTGPLPPQQAARYIMLCARGLQYAHDHGVLHRDLKPSNIMIDEHDDPRIMDFGLAKRVDDSKHHTLTGTVLGTPSYMSPEQATGDTRKISNRSDVYSLGAVLYELLTGRPPFCADNHLDTLLHVVQSEPVPPRLLNPKVDVDLENICLKCLEKNPKDRYPSAGALADDLERYLRGDAVQARSTNVFDRLTRTLDRGHHDVAFHTWSTMLYWIAAIVVGEHFLVFLLTYFQFPDWLLVSARCSQFVLIGLVFWRNRGDRLLPATAAERELWTIWIGYILAYMFVALSLRILVGRGVVTGGADAPEMWANLMVYPVSSVLSGLAFFVMGANYWGRCYAIGLSFMAATPLVAMIGLQAAPLVFGVLWGVALCVLARRLEYLGRTERVATTAAPTIKS